MPNIFVKNLANDFQPMSYEELVAPFIRYRDDFDKDANTISEYQSNAEKMRKIAEGEAPNDEGYTLNMWNSYNNHLNDIADELMTKGRTMNTIPNILSLKKRYNSEILPIESAYAKREAMKDYELKNPDFIYQRNANDISLKDIIENPNMNYTNESKKNIYDRAKDQYKAIGESFNDFASSGYKDTGIPFVKEANDRYGITPKQLANAIEGRADSSVYGKLMKMVEDRIFEGTNVYKWTKEIDPLRPDYKYKDQEEMARDIIRSAMPEALGKIQRRQLTDQYGLNLALAREKKKLEDEGNIEPPVVDEYSYLSLTPSGWNDDINESIKILDKTNSNSFNYNKILPDISIYTTFGGGYSSPKMFKENGDLISYEEFKNKYGDVINKDSNLFLKDGKTSRGIGVNRRAYGDDNANKDKLIKSIYDQYTENLAKKMTELGITKIVQENGILNINKSIEESKKDLEGKREVAFYNYAPFKGSATYGPGQALLNLINSGGNTLIKSDNDSNGKPSFNAKKLKTFDSKTYEPVYENVSIPEDVLFKRPKNSVGRQLNDNVKIENIGYSFDGNNVVIEYTDASKKLNHMLVPIEAIGPKGQKALYDRYRQKFNTFARPEVMSAWISQQREIRPEASFSELVDAFYKRVNDMLVPDRNAIMEYLFKNLKEEKTKR